MRQSTAECTSQTGVEMEALTACSVALLTIYDICKAVDWGMTVDGVRLVENPGGKSGRSVAASNMDAGALPRLRDAWHAQRDAITEE